MHANQQRDFDAGSSDSTLRLRYATDVELRWNAAAAPAREAWVTIIAGDRRTPREQRYFRPGDERPS